MIGLMTEHNLKKQSFENPVGEDLPFVKFDVPLWQVFVALFLIAMVLTAFKFHERRNIAPFKKVQWNTLDLLEFKQERLQRRNIMLWVHTQDEARHQELGRIFESPEVQATVYLNRCLAFQLPTDMERDENLEAWLAKMPNNLAKGGIGYWLAGEPEPVVLSLDDLDGRQLIELLEGRQD